MPGCDAKIRPFPNDTEVECESKAGHRGTHQGVLRNYAHTGSVTKFVWHEEDRRTFRGEWEQCPGNKFQECVLPLGHPGNHAS